MGAVFRFHHPDRNPERGNSMILSITVLAALATLSGLTVITTRGTMSQETNDRFHTIALRAAESGAAATMDFLRDRCLPGAVPSPPNPASHWTTWLTTTPTFLANGAMPGTPNNQFRPDQQAYYNAVVVNNKNDVGYNTNPSLDRDNDCDVVIRSTGHGPNGAVAVVEWEVQGQTSPTSKPLTLVAWHEVL